MPHVLKNQTARVKILNLKSGMIHLNPLQEVELKDEDLDSLDIQVQVAQKHCVLREIPAAPAVKEPEPAPEPLMNQPIENDDSKPGDGDSENN